MGKSVFSPGLQEEKGKAHTHQQGQGEGGEDQRRQRPVERPVFEGPDPAQMDDEQRQRDDEQIMPRVEEAQQAVGDHADPAEHDQHSLVEAGAVESETQGDGRPGGRIRLHVPDIVDIQYAHAEQPDGRGRQEKGPGRHGVAGHEVGAEDGDQAEEDKDRDVAESPVTVGVPAEGVFHGPADRGGAEHHQADAVHREKGAETDFDHRQAETDAEHDEKGDQAFYLGHRQLARVQAVARSLPVGGVRPVQHVAQVVADVGQNLEAGGGQDKEQDGQRPDMVIGHGQQGSEQDTGQRKGHGPEAQGTEGGKKRDHGVTYVLGKEP